MRFAEPFLTLTPTVDGEVLAVLARDEHWHTVDELHALVPDRSPEGIRLVVRRLVGQGVIESQRAGRGSVYRLSRDHLAAAAVLHISGLWQLLETRVAEHVAAWPHPPLDVELTLVPDGDEAPEILEVTIIRPLDVDTGWERAVAELTMDISRWTGNEVRVVEVGAAGDR